MYRRIRKCRVCGNPDLVPVVDLGEQYLTGVFPRQPSADAVTKGPLRLVKCHDGENACDLLQLEHTYDLEELYGANYGYRSGLNASMVRHLHAKVARIRNAVELQRGDLVVDIGSNDGTTLGAYPADLLLVGIDPTGEKFRNYYAGHVKLIPGFFSADLLTRAFPGRKAKVVTSFSMFYDLESPLDFAREVASVLDPVEGIWVLEQSYMPLMMERNSYDTICHEHLEYYGLKQIAWLAERAGLKIVDVEINDVNGGSFSVTAAPLGSRRTDVHGIVARMLADEKAAGLSDLAPYQAFYNRIEQSRRALRDFVADVRGHGKRLCGLGASTKGNVVLQYCRFNAGDIEAIGDVNPDKFGAFTPGTWIPIAPEAGVLASSPDYLLILPWHFREFFLRNPALAGRRLVFPLPQLEVVIPQGR
ncbi:MAG: methyltransferase domain-containing protein [Betaproteobacteria bacterium]|nr:methyltransferase domain-containing protein [Betaproteobacteria bacterium]